jgi:hypothetical protein
MARANRGKHDYLAQGGRYQIAIWHVHQLQNLYTALTGNDLEINL